MSRSSTAPIGHNHRDLNDEEMGALVTSFTTKLIDAKRKEDVLVVDLKSARRTISGIFKLIKKETGYDRGEFERVVIANLDKSEEELVEAARREARLQQQAGLRSGEQLDLIERIADTVDDAIAAEAQGYRAGRRADEPKPPGELNTIFHQDWMRGYTRGQEVNAKAEAMAAEILARPKPGEMAAAPEDDEAETDDEAEIEAEVARLEREGWAGPTKEEAEFVESDNGRTVRAA